MVEVVGCTSALRDAQHLSYVVFKSFARRLHETIRYHYDDMHSFFSLLMSGLNCEPVLELE